MERRLIFCTFLNVTLLLPLCLHSTSSYPLCFRIFSYNSVLLLFFLIFLYSLMAIPLIILLRFLLCYPIRDVSYEIAAVLRLPPPLLPQIPTLGLLKSRYMAQIYLECLHPSLKSCYILLA